MKTSELNLHVDKVHRGKCNCSECGNLFMSPSNLKQHIEFVHEGRKDYNCSECSKSFGTTNVLKRHIECAMKDEDITNVQNVKKILVKLEI